MMMMMKRRRRRMRTTDEDEEEEEEEEVRFRPGSEKELLHALQNTRFPESKRGNVRGTAYIP